MDVADAAMEKQRVLSALVQKMNAAPSAVGGGKATIALPNPLQVITNFINSLPPLFPASKSTAATEALKVKHPGAEVEVLEEVIVVPAEVAEEVTSPQREIIRLYYE